MDPNNKTRLPVFADVDLQFPGHEYISARARDISDKGMFVETAGTRLPPHAMVNVRVWNQARRSCFHVMCIIMRRTCHGVGVMFLRGTEKAEQELRAWRAGFAHASRSTTPA